MIGYTSARYDGSPENRYRSHRWCESHAEAVGHIPQKTPSTGPVIRHISVLWCVTHPPAPYITRAVSRPASDNSLTMSMNCSCISANAVSSAGQSFISALILSAYFLCHGGSISVFQVPCTV